MGGAALPAGHPEPFGLRMLGIGNEQWETEEVDFFHRYELFEQAIHEKYSEIRLLGSAGPNVNSKEYGSGLELDPSGGREKKKILSMRWMSIIMCHRSGALTTRALDDNYPRNVKVFAGGICGASPGYRRHRPAQ